MNRTVTVLSQPEGFVDAESRLVPGVSETASGQVETNAAVGNDALPVESGPLSPENDPLFDENDSDLTARGENLKSNLVTGAADGAHGEKSLVEVEIETGAGVPKPPARPLVRGCVDRLSMREAVGWVSIVDETAEGAGGLVDVRIEVDGALVSFGTATHARPDVVKAGLGPLHCGFSLSIPEDVFEDGQPHLVQVLESSTGQLLKKGETVLQAGESGPLSSENDPPAVVNDIDLTARGAGFVSIEKAVAADKTLVKASLIEVEKEIVAEASERAHPVVRGYVDRLSMREAVGWVSIVDEPAEGAQGLVDVCVLVDGTPVSLGMATHARPDVVEAGQGPLHCGFSISIPEEIFEDGRPHLVQVLENSTGQVLKKGETVLQAVREGVVFFDRDRQALVGWARGSEKVSILFDGTLSSSVAVDRPVPGFEPGPRLGFLLPIPEALIDGRWHQVEAFFGNSKVPLDGAPFSFRLEPTRVHVDIREIIGRRVHARARNSMQKPLDLLVGVQVDGKRLLQVRTVQPAEDLRSQECSTGLFSFPVPRGARSLVLLDESGEVPVVLSKFEILPPRRDAPESVEVAEVELTSRIVSELSDRSFDEAECTKISAAFESFRLNPGTQFDPLWYTHIYPDASLAISSGTVKDALSHYCELGAKAGHSPNPWFDEILVRNRYPAIVAAIADGRIPCAFAVELALGPGSLRAPLNFDARKFADLVDASSTDWSLIKTIRETAEQIGERLQSPANREVLRMIPAQLAPPTSWREPSASIYAAWFARLGIDANTKHQLEADEAELRAEIQSVHLTRAPLVSIIMPTFNRAFTIGEAIQSVLDQSYCNWELLICDDASVDPTSEVVAQFRDSRIRYFQFLKSNGAGARNKGLAFARGEYISYLDSDNLWNPHFLDLMLRKLLADPGCVIVYSSYLDTEIVGAKVMLLKMPHPTFRPIDLSRSNFMDLNTIVHHRCVFDWLGGFDGDLERLQDWDLMLRYTSIFRPTFVDRHLVFYRRNIAWRQVTDVFRDAGIKNTVNEKTAARINNGHERLAIDWPRRARVLIINGPTEGAQVAGSCIARLASRFADVDLVDLVEGNSPIRRPAPTHQGVRVGRIPVALEELPERLAYWEFDMLHRGRAVIVVGLSERLIRRFAEPQHTNVYRLATSQHGLFLLRLRDQAPSFYLGAAPIELLWDNHSGTKVEPRRQLLLMAREGNIKDLVKISERASELKMDILVPPSGYDNAWKLLAGGTMISLGAFSEEPVVQALRRCWMTVVCKHVADLTAFEFSLIASLQGQGVPLAVIKDDEKRSGGVADQWIACGAAYEIAKNDPDWIFEKLEKLRVDEQKYNTLRGRGMKAHGIVHHPELTLGRLAHFLFRTNFEQPEIEVRHVK